MRRRLAASDGWAPIKGGSLPGTDARIDDFEMADHPVTNAEYKQFIDAAKYPPPSHWEKGAIPAGMENWPVIFVNRPDVASYSAWLTKRDRRIYRLPTASEFHYAARAGQAGAAYAWGDESPEGRANYDAGGKRNLSQWRKCLKPVKSYKPNPWGLYDMAGNVFQMVDRYVDTTVPGGYTFRAVHSYDREALVRRRVLGPQRAPAAPGFVQRFLFRPSHAGTRLPPGSGAGRREAHFRRELRGVVAAADGSGGVYVGWRLLPGDDAGSGFHVYRAANRETAGVRITAEAIRDSTNFIDRKPAPTDRHGTASAQWGTRWQKEARLRNGPRRDSKSVVWSPCLSRLRARAGLYRLSAISTAMARSMPSSGSTTAWGRTAPTRECRSNSRRS